MRNDLTKGLTLTRAEGINKTMPNWFPASQTSEHCSLRSDVNSLHGRMAEATTAPIHFISTTLLSPRVIIDFCPFLFMQLILWFCQDGWWIVSQELSAAVPQQLIIKSNVRNVNVSLILDPLPLASYKMDLLVSKNSNTLCRDIFKIPLLNK